jgi:hypothetical protein
MRYHRGRHRPKSLPRAGASADCRAPYPGSRIVSLTSPRQARKVGLLRWMGIVVTIYVCNRSRARIGF